MHIIENIDNNEGLRQFYTVDWAVLPNLAMDVIVPPLLNGLSPYVAGKIFIFLIFLLLVSGTCALHRALHGETSYWPLLSVLFLYNRHFLWGFTNFLFGTGVCLWTLAFWFRFVHRSAFFRVSVFSMFSLLLFFSHLYAFGIYGLCILGCALHRHLRENPVNPWREWGVSLAQFIVPAILFLFFSPTASSAALRDIHFGAFSRKFGSIFQPINNYSHLFDGFTFAVLAGIFFFGWWLGKVRLNPRMRYPLLFLILFYLLMPERLLTVHAADTRIPTPFAFLLLAACRPLHIEQKTKTAIIGLLACIFLVRLIVIGVYWNRADGQYAGYRQALIRMEENPRLFTAIADPGPWQPFPTPIRHLPCIAVIERSALVPSLFANKTQQPVRFAPAYRPLVGKTPGPAFGANKKMDWHTISKHYDYLLIVREPLFSEPPPARWETVYHGDSFRLLKIP